MDARALPGTEEEGQRNDVRVEVRGDLDHGPDQLSETEGLRSLRYASGQRWPWYSFITENAANQTITMDMTASSTSKKISRPLMVRSGFGEVRTDGDGASLSVGHRADAVRAATQGLG
ncbi:hypothetical protein GCM10009738_69660 [Kitasatospora viridis]